MGRLFAVEIVYRGIFQKKLAANISRAIVLAAHKEGNPGISFGRYGDSPERNGIPAKYFAIVATDETTLEEGKAKYEPKGVDISICVDDTLFKGVESWAWYGLQPINKLLKPGGTLIVTSLKEADQLIPLAHRKETPYKLAVLKGTPSFSGLWVYKDDHTDVRILGVMARVLPELFSLGSVQETIRDEWKNELKATSALRAFERVTTVLTVTPALRIPMVAIVCNRALDDPGAFGVEHNDALAVRDLSWQLVWADNAQEALDTALIAFEVATADGVDVVMVGMGTLANPVSVAIREIRKEGKKVGLVRVRWLRAVRAGEPAKSLSRSKAVGSIDRELSLGAPHSSGVLATE